LKIFFSGLKIIGKTKKGEKKMGNFFYQDYIKTSKEDVLKIEFEYNTPIVNIIMKPKIKFSTFSACIFSWHRIEETEGESKKINKKRQLYISRTVN
jgi:hypothetical protein